MFNLFQRRHIFVLRGRSRSTPRVFRRRSASRLADELAWIACMVIIAAAALAALPLARGVVQNCVADTIADLGGP